MRAQARVLALSFALIAMTLRGLLPAGWMLDPGSTTLTICTIDGRAHIAVDQNGHPAKQTPAQDHQLCPFAGAPSLALADSPTASFSLIVAEHTHDTLQAFAVTRLGGHTPQAPRAPPSFS